MNREIDAGLNEPSPTAIIDDIIFSCWTPDTTQVSADVEVESFKNPVTGEEQDTKLQLPKGFIFQLADACKTKLMKITTAGLNFDDSGKNAFYSKVEYSGP